MGRAKIKTLKALASEIDDQIRVKYPNLHAYEKSNHVLVKGTFPVLSEGSALDRYSIEIEVPQDYPRTWPKVKETANRIPRHIDFHIDSNGYACVLLEDEAFILFPNGLSFLDFLDGPVHNYFLSQSVVGLGGDWPFGQHAHEIYGVVEFYQDLLETSDLAELENCLKCLVLPSLKGHHPCPCGNGRKYRNCHQSRVASVKPKTKREFIIKTLTYLRILKSRNANGSGLN